MLADKLTAFYSRKRFCRAKDIYDIYILLKTQNVDLLKLHDIFKKRNVVPEEPLPLSDESIKMLETAYGKLKLNLADGMPITDRPEFNQVMNAVILLLNALRKIEEGDNQFTFWEAGNGFLL